MWLRTFPFITQARYDLVFCTCILQDMTTRRWCDSGNIRADDNFSEKQQDTDRRELDSKWAWTRQKRYLHSVPFRLMTQLGWMHWRDGPEECKYSNRDWQGKTSDATDANRIWASHPPNAQSLSLSLSLSLKSQRASNLISVPQTVFCPRPIGLTQRSPS